MILLFIVFPTLILILYPFRYFQKFLSCFPLQWRFLYTFVDSFQGCFKDGTQPGVLDYRWFAVVRLTIRVMFYIMLAVTLGAMYFVHANVVLIGAMVLFINFQPFKKATVKYPITDTVFLTLLSLTLVISAGYNVAIVERHNFFLGIFILIGIATVWIISTSLYTIPNAALDCLSEKMEQKTLTRLRFMKN